MSLGKVWAEVLLPRPDFKTFLRAKQLLFLFL